MSETAGERSGRGHGVTDTEGVAVGNRVRLPAGAEPPYVVYINGVRQKEDVDYRVVGNEIRFAEPIVKEGKLGGVRWLSMLIGLVGSYGKHETVDVECAKPDGTRTLASDLPVIAD